MFTEIERTLRGGHRQNGTHGNTRVKAAGWAMGGMTFSAVQTSAKAGVVGRYLPKRVGLAAKIETSKEVSPHNFHSITTLSCCHGVPIVLRPCQVLYTFTASSNGSEAMRQ